MIKADLQIWFDRPYHTVRTWLLRGSEPRDPGRREAYRRLEILEKAIAAQQGFPIPSTLSNLRRPEHVQQLRDSLLAHYSAGGRA